MAAAAALPSVQALEAEIAALRADLASVSDQLAAAQAAAVEGLAEHVSNVQRGGATVTGRPDKPQNSLLQVFTQVLQDLLWALPENSAQTDQVKRKSAQRKQHYLRP